ncbi:cyclophilin-like protein [Pseudovirgaria hyperparasitica]|uniref:Peptidyl-prolyl cis-trans isomerase n=1 Tax=Pseudovirgaria hyperparasitica TaxID=470096 RepID=A0A6A6WAQ2_9PEZI|nr:cyclophilin-like protein [Pseudovirgaria hyperparasitica]KAF2758667.1 cyclophilin-like protein [Pseudovirgaria hyperparasitica]
MSVLLETSAGDLVVDLLVDQAPKACENFLKLCKIKYYNYSPIYSVQKDFSFTTGDPIGPGSADSDGGSSIWGLLDPANPTKKTFPPEFHPKLKHSERGTISFSTAPDPQNDDTRVAGSQFIVTLGDNLEYLDGKAAVFGNVIEGFDALENINGAFTDDSGRPLKDIRILHTHIIDDPYFDPAGLQEPDQSPIPSAAQLATVRIAHDERLDPDADQENIEKLRREREARAQALTLEMMGDLPFAEVKPPENVLFVCKLNPVTQDEDLELIFSRFGKILSCEVIRDKRTGDSLQYAFIEFEEKEDCERAYHKMDGTLIDDHRIHVDFSQSVSRLSDTWRTATNAKRKKHAGPGFGGLDALEQKTQYKTHITPKQRGSGYGIMVNQGRPGNTQGRSPERNTRMPSRSRSPRRRTVGREEDRERHSSFRQRDRSSERRYDDRRRERSRHRDRDSRRRDRDRDYDRRRDDHQLRH